MPKFLFLFILVCTVPAGAQNKTYCNPMNLDYGYTPIPNFSEWGRHRATADPVIVNYKGTYILFSTNQWGYWYSKDLSDWTFVSHKFLRPRNKVYDELCAPAVGIVGDTLLVFGSTYTSEFTLWGSTNPMANEWFPIVENFEIGGWDPDFFTDTDGKLYMYNGSSNVYPLYGVQLDRKTFDPIGTRKEMYALEDWRYGWQGFGEHMDNTFLDPFMEGAHMTKNNGKYYLQYGAPGTEFSGYADGVAVGTNPLGPFVNQPDPLSMKLGGFARGAGHGATFQDNWKNYWHISSIMLSVKNNFERRLGLWPAGFDKDDVMYCNTAFGDYPHFLPNGETDHLKSQFTGWMLLNYGKPVEVSSTLGGYLPNYAVDEVMKTYWSAKTGNNGEYLISDLGALSDIRAIQVNFADQDVDSSFLGKINGISHKYVISVSLDGEKWTTAVDKSKNTKDVPHDYIELKEPVYARYVKIENRGMPSGKFALSGFRVFGNGGGEKPGAVEQFMVLRTLKDKRSCWIKWKPVNEAFAYNIYYGTAPDKLYNCIMVHGNNEYWFAGLDKLSTYYFTIEAISENGISVRFETVKVE